MLRSKEEAMLHKLRCDPDLTIQCISIYYESYVYIYTCIYIYIYTYIYIYIYVYNSYVYIYIYIHTYVGWDPGPCGCPSTFCHRRPLLTTIIRLELRQRTAAVASSGAFST